MAEEPTPENYIEGDISHLGIAAIQVHELFLELKNAGFSHKEALQLAGDVLAHAVVDPYDGEDSDYEDPDMGVVYEITFAPPEQPDETDSEEEEVSADEEDSGNIEED